MRNFLILRRTKACSLYFKGIEKKGKLLGRDVDGSEGGREFIVPYSAHLNEESKYSVSCGLRSAGVVEDALSSGVMRAVPKCVEAKKLHGKQRKEREIGE